MARRKIEDKNIRSLTSTAGGRGYSVTLPVAVVRKFKWKRRQKLELEIDSRRKRIIIKDWKG